MTLKKKLIVKFTLLTTAGLFTAISFAATQPSQITQFNASTTYDVFTVKSKGWSDPAFGDMGWTHFSDWGTFKAKKGQTVNIRLVSQSVGIHPGATVWYRGLSDTAPDSYVVDHFYPQNAPFFKYGATDEGSGSVLGNIVMRIIGHGYDVDGNTSNIKRFHPISDGIPGTLELTFTAPRTGNYQFVVGGYNPDAGVSNSPRYNIDTTVNITDSAP